MKTRWKILIALGILLLLAAASAWVTAHHQPQNAVEDYKKLLRAKGEKLELSEVLPPSMPPESNSVNAVRDAFSMFGSGNEKIPDAMKMVAPGKAMVGWMQLDARSSDFTNSWDDFTADVEANRPAIELLHQVLERPKLDFQLDYKKGIALLLPHLSPLKRATQKLDAAVIYDLHNGERGAAVTNILTMLALVQRNASEGLLISHLVRIAMTSITVTPTWEFLQAANATDAPLAALQKGWEQMDFLSDAENTFETDRVWGMDFIQKARASHENFEGAFSVVASMSSSGSSSSGWDWETITEKSRHAVAEVMWRSSWSYSDELRTLKGEQIVLEALRTMQTNQSQFYKADYDAMTSRLSSLGITNAGEAFFRALKIPNLNEVFGDWGSGPAVRKAIKMQASCRVVVAAIALKRFQLKHGKWPDTLNELAPEFLPSVPVDPYDGKPLRYHPNADGTFLLYCVGEDGVDDGGDPNLPVGITSSSLNWQNAHARDWVWPQPATEAEIKFFYEHPPK